MTASVCEQLWQIVKVALGALVIYAVMKWDFRKDERMCGAITLAGATAALLGGVAGLLAEPVEALWLGRLGLATLMLSIVQWLRLRHLERACGL